MDHTRIGEILGYIAILAAVLAVYGFHATSPESTGHSLTWVATAIALLGGATAIYLLNI